MLRVGKVAAEIATGALNVSEEAGGCSLSVERGAAQVTASGHSLPVAAGEALDFGAGGLARRPAAPEASAWREGLIVAQDEPLAVIVERIARWLPARVVLMGSALAQKRSGVFRMEAPEPALLAAVSPHGGQLRRISPWLIVITAL